MNTKKKLCKWYLERFHNLGGLAFLVVGKDASDNDDNRQDDAKVKVVIWRLLKSRCLDSVSDEAKDCAKPEQESKPTCEELKIQKLIEGLRFRDSRSCIFDRI